MADAPIVATRNISRDQLASFLKSHELIKAFENLMQDVSVTLPAYALENANAAEEGVALALIGIEAANQSLSALKQASMMMEAIDAELSTNRDHRADVGALHIKLEEIESQIGEQARTLDLCRRLDDLEAYLAGINNPPLTPPVEQFIAPTLLNSWVNFGSPFNNAGYFKDQSGVVHLRGLVKSGIIGSAIATLPTGYRPQNTEIMPTISNDLFGCIKILATGDVVPAIGNNTYFSMDNISFRAA